MFIHVLDHGGARLFARDLAADGKIFLDAVAPFRAGLVVGCECMFDDGPNANEACARTATFWADG